MGRADNFFGYTKEAASGISGAKVPGMFVLLFIIVVAILALGVGGGVISIIVSLWKVLFTGMLAERIPIPIVLVGVLAIIFVLRAKPKNPREYY